MTVSIVVPTSSVIAVKPNDPYQVCVIEQNGKHKGRLHAGRRQGHHAFLRRTSSALWKNGTRKPAASKPSSTT